MWARSLCYATAAVHSLPVFFLLPDPSPRRLFLPFVPLCVLVVLPLVSLSGLLGEAMRRASLPSLFRRDALYLPSTAPSTSNQW